MKFWNSGVVWNVASCDAGQPPSLSSAAKIQQETSETGGMVLKQGTTGKPVKCDVAQYNHSQVKPLEVTPVS